MRSYTDVIETLPKEFQLPMMKIVDRLREEILDTVRRSDFQELKGVVSALSERMADFSAAQLELAEAQGKTERRLEELAEAQKKTEETVRGLVKGQAQIRKEVGGLSNSFGYVLENEAIRYLPGILQRERGIEIEVMDRRYIVYADGRDDELNIYGEGLLEGEKMYVVGESKAQLGKRDVDRFHKLVRWVSDHLKARVIPVLVTHSIHPQVEVYARKKIKELEIYKSYELK